MDYSLLSHKKNEIMSFAITWMELETLILSKVSRTKTNDIIYMWNLKTKKIQDRSRPTDIENKFMVTKGERLG